MRNYFERMYERKTYIDMIKELDAEYTPEYRGLVNMKEIYFINECLHLDSMTEYEMMNLRDMVTLWFMVKLDNHEEDLEYVLKIMDKVSAITSVIDNKLKNYEEKRLEIKFL